MNLIRDAVRTAIPDASAAELSATLGISRTAQRHLSRVAQQGSVDVHLKNGTTGRPEHRYRSRHTRRDHRGRFLGLRRDVKQGVRLPSTVTRPPER